LLICSSEAKTNGKNKKPKQVVPDIECDVRAGKVSYPEFIVKCPASCRETNRGYTGRGSSPSYPASAIGVITNEGGKVIVKKMAGQAEYKGSLANGIRSLSLPNWRESFTVSVGKPKKGVIYPSTLDYASSKPATVKTGEGSCFGSACIMICILKVIHNCSPFKKRRPEILSSSSSSSSYSGFGTREQDSLPQAPEAVFQGDPNCKVDIAFLMDGSWSIGKRRFKIQKDFLMEVSQVLSVGMAGPMMGIIQYGDDPVTEFSLRQFSSSKDLKLAIDKIVQKGGLSNVGKALSYINKHYFSDSNGNRGGAPNVAVILVDGWPTDKVEEASRLARESGINIFFVTIEGPDDNEKQNVVEPNFVDKAVCRTSGFFSLPVASWFALRKAVQPLVKRVCDTDRLVCSKTCLNANDIAFVIDGSSSVGTGNFRTVLQFVANVTREFEISDTDTRVGAVQYTYEQRLEFAFGQHNTKADVLNAVKRISYWSGGTSTGAAITYAAAQLFSKSKPNKRKIMIVITDGRSYDDVRAPALAVHRQGVIAYSIGIAWAAQDELEYIATDPDRDHSFFVDEFDNLYKYVPKIINNICQEFNSQPRN
uniref:Vitrin n=1 Tax=Electrophorus electricus TaxID=8005 RepID=A0A4W4ERX0_ELEEL